MCNIDTVKTLYLGHYEEKNSRTVQIDVSSWMTPTAQFSIIFKRYGDTQEYFAENVVVDESGILTWTLTLFDMAVKGNGQATIVRIDGETIKKTGIIRTVVDDSLPTNANPNPPEPVPSWLTEVLEKADEILDAQAEQFNINEQGHLIVTKIDGTTEDLGQVVGSGGVISVNGKTGVVVLDALDVSATAQVTGEFLYNNGSKIEDPKWHNKTVQCTTDYQMYQAGYFYKISSDGDLREQRNTQPLQEVQYIQKTGSDLNDIRDLEAGNIYQCTSDRWPDHATISNDSQFHQGYFYLYNGEQAQYTYTRIDVQPTSGGGTSDYADLTNKPKINNVELDGNKTTSDLGLFSGDYADLSGKPTIPSKTSDLQNDSGFLTDNDTLAVGSVEVDVNSIKPYDYEQTYTIPNDITSGSTVYIEFAYPLREFALEITTPEKVISAGTGYFYLSLENNVGGGRFWEPALGQSHASKLCVSFTVGRDGIYRLNGYKYDLTNNSDYSLMTSYNTLARQNIGRLFLENPRPIASIYFTSGGDISELAGTTIKVRGLRW